MRVQFGTSQIELAQGDITLQQVDAIVNAANSALAGGGGVDGAIHEEGGATLMQETRRRYPQGCPTGSAVATGAGKLKAKFVFHAVGPVWRGGQKGEPELLAGAYRRCLEMALEHQCRSVAFPAISTGVYGYPRDLAAETAVEAICEFFAKLPPDHAGLEVRVVLFDAGSFGAWARVLERLVTSSPKLAGR